MMPRAITTPEPRATPGQTDDLTHHIEHVSGNLARVLCANRPAFDDAVKTQHAGDPVRPGCCRCGALARSHRRQ